MDSEITKIPSTGQGFVSAFDHENELLYFDILTMKMTELDFDVFIPNVDLYLSFKWYNNLLNLIIVTQDIAEI